MKFEFLFNKKLSGTFIWKNGLFCNYSYKLNTGKLDTKIKCH